MAVAITVNPRFPRGLFLGNIIAIDGTLVFSGSYAAGGETIDFGALVGYSNKQPLDVHVTGIAGAFYEYDFAAGKLRIRTGAAAQTLLTELSNGAYPGTITGDTVSFFVFIPKM